MTYRDTIPGNVRIEGRAGHPHPSSSRRPPQVAPGRTAAWSVRREPAPQEELLTLSGPILLRRCPRRDAPFFPSLVDRGRLAPIHLTALTETTLMSTLSRHTMIAKGYLHEPLDQLQ